MVVNLFELLPEGGGMLGGDSEGRRVTKTPGNNLLKSGRMGGTETQQVPMVHSAMVHSTGGPRCQVMSLLPARRWRKVRRTMDATQALGSNSVSDWGSRR